MKNYTKLIFLLMFPLLLNSQSNSGKITYQYLVNTGAYLKQKNKKNSKLVKTTNYINNSLREGQDKLKFELSFNNSSSIYQMKPLTISDGNTAMKYAIIFNEAENEYFLDKKNKIKLTSIEAYGERFHIKEKLNNQKWETTSISKKIGNYVCYKATTVKIIENPKGKFNKKIIAWYTPEIPFNYGPKGYDGLPGLILELQEGTLLYYTTNIKLSTKNIKIKKPKNGKIITIEQFNEIGLKTGRKRKNKN